MQPPIIELEGLSKYYGSLKAVDDLTLRIAPGEIYGLLGPNGAGKTTTILMMLGLTEPTSGTATVCGIDATTRPIEVKRKVGYMPDSVGFYDSMSALDNLIYVARLSGLPEKQVKEQARQMMELVGLQDAMDKRTSVYSRGMKQRLGLADVLIRQPSVIVLDEPTLGIDPSGVKDFLVLIRELSRQQGITVLLSSHQLHHVQQVCDRVGIFVGGKLLADGNVASLWRNLSAGENTVVTIRLANQGMVDETILSAFNALEGVTGVSLADQSLQVSCTHNITPALVRACVEWKLEVMGVHQQEYGLEDIYHRYFENNVNLDKKDGTSTGFFQRTFFRKPKA